MNRFVKTLTLALLAVSIAAPSYAEARKRWKRLYSNVTQEDMGVLFKGVAHVGFGGANQKETNQNQHAMAVTWFGKDGSRVECFFSSDMEFVVFSSTFEPTMIDSTRRKETYPLLKYGTAVKTGFRTVIYSPDGGTGLYMHWKGYWWEQRLGHLQARLPAATWTACPDFPSAASLGAKVNQKQTSTNYMELLAQDKGKRIKRPDLITKDTVVKY